MNCFQGKKSLSIVLVVSIALFSILFNCAKDESTAPKEEAPPAPPKASFVMDLSALPDTSSSAPFQKVYDPTENQNTFTYANWGWSALNVAFWNAALTLTLIVPVAAFNATIQATPELQEDGRWLWTKTFTIGGVLHTAKLYGKTGTDGIEWEMYISKNNDYQDFKWYTGLSNLPVTEGSWTLYKSPDDPVEFLGIEWHHNWQQDSGDIQYTNIVPGDAENGGYIYYEKTNDTPFNAGYDIYNKGMDNLTEMEWDRTARDGRVRDPLHFGDSDWHCWDMDLMDTVCP